MDYLAVYESIKDAVYKLSNTVLQNSPQNNPYANPLFLTGILFTTIGSIGFTYACKLALERIRSQ